jgi:hypothetical protein
MRDTPDAWVSKPPPLIGAVLPVRELATTVSEPELIMPPPLPAVLPESASPVRVAVPRLRTPPPRPAVFPPRTVTPDRRSDAAAATCRMRKGAVAAGLRRR